MRFSGRSLRFCAFGGILFCSIATSSAQTDLVDFRYAPARSYASVCLVDDWQKSLVSHTGALAYNFGPGPYATPRTEVSVGVQGKALTVARHYFDDPLVPIVNTELVGDGVRMTQRAFALIPSDAQRRARLLR